MNINKSLKIYLSNSQGLGNRIKFIASNIRIFSPKKIDLYWPQNGWVPTSFSSLFDFKSKIIITEYDQETIKKNVPLKPPLSYTEGCRLYVGSTDGLPKNFSKLYFPSKNGYGIDFEYNRIPKKILDTYLPFFNNLKPSISVINRLKDIKLPKKYVGLQIRNHESWKQFGRNENLDLFFNEINKYPKTTIFYLSCMSQEVSSIINKKYPNQIIELPHKEYPSSMIDAVADMYNLSKATNGIYSYGSSFAEVAWWLGGCTQKIIMVGNIRSWQTPAVESEKTIYYYIDKDKIKNPEKHIKKLNAVVDKFIYEKNIQLKSDPDNVIIDASNIIPKKKSIIQIANYIHHIQHLELELNKTKQELMNIKDSKFFNLWQKVRQIVNKIKNIRHKIDIKSHISEQFLNQVGYVLNLDNPKSFNEKVQWLKLNYHNPLMTLCADKVNVRDYISKTIGSKYLIPAIGIYDSEKQINYQNLPNKFILKVNNGSGANIICNDKSKLDIKETNEKLKQWLLPQSNHYFYSYEWSYKNIKPKIICEQLIETKDDLVDYKFTCVNGKIIFVSVCTDRHKKLKVTFFTPKWKRLPFSRSYPVSKKRISKPSKYNEMVDIVTKLSSNFPFVRVDLYQANNQIYFGEMTFYPGNGMGKFEPEIWDYKLGDKVILPNKL